MPYPRLQISVRYLYANKKATPPPVTNGKEAYQVIKNICNQHHILWIEEILLLCLSSNNTLRTWDQVAIGGMDYANLDMGTFATRASSSACPRFILAHNHPSGSLTPSADDFELTRQVLELFRIMRYQLEDHIIFTDSGYYSMKEAGLL